MPKLRKEFIVKPSTFGTESVSVQCRRRWGFGLRSGQNAQVCKKEFARAFGFVPRTLTRVTLNGIRVGAVDCDRDQKRDGLPPFKRGTFYTGLWTPQRVEVGANRWGDRSGRVPLPLFVQAFGFTPEKGKLYTVTIGEFKKEIL